MAASAALKSPPPGAALADNGDDATYVPRFTTSIELGLADADADDVMDIDELEAWLAARRSERPRK